MKKTNIIIIILMLLVLGLSGYIVYDKVLNTEDVNTNYRDNNNQNDGNEVDNNNNQDVNIENIVLPEWVKYLTGFDLVLTESVYDYDKNECVDEEVSISQSDLKKVLAELSTKELIKNYYGSVPPVGSACNGLFRLTYGENSIQFQITGDFSTNDKVLDSKLDLDINGTWYQKDYKEFDGYAYYFPLFEEGELTTIVNKYITNK